MPKKAVPAQGILLHRTRSSLPSYVLVGHWCEESLVACQSCCVTEGQGGLNQPLSTGRHKQGFGHVAEAESVLLGLIAQMPEERTLLEHTVVNRPAGSALEAERKTPVCI